MRKFFTVGILAAGLALTACAQEAEVTEAEAPVLTDPVDTAPEMAQADMPPGQNAGWDLNNDGLFQEAEYTGWRDRGYAQWDTNSDQRIAASEFESGWTNAGFENAQGVFTEWDDNSDGFLDAGEWFGEDEWNTWDANDSGVLENNEFGFY